MYVMRSTRPDLCFPVGYLGRFKQSPTTAHWSALKRVVQYAKGTRSLGLMYEPNKQAPPLVREWIFVPCSRMYGIVV